MRRLAFVIVALGLLTLGSCASSRPCPAYAQGEVAKEIKG